MGSPRKDRNTVAEKRLTIRVTDGDLLVLDELIQEENEQRALRGDPLSASHSSVIRGLIRQAWQALPRREKGRLKRPAERVLPPVVELPGERAGRKLVTGVPVLDEALKEGVPRAAKAQNGEHSGEKAHVDEHPPGPGEGVVAGGPVEEGPSSDDLDDVFEQL